jgi:hypothetical protein
MKFSGCLRQYEIIQVIRIGREYLVGKPRGLKKGQIDSWRYELPVPV